MAFAVIEGTNTSNDASLRFHTVDLPTGIVVGELLIVQAMFAFGPATQTITWPAGWTQIILETVGDNITMETRFRIADGSEGATITLDADTFPSGEASIHSTYRISGDDTAVQAPEGASAQGGTISPNPPNLTPTGGAKDYLWLATMYKRATNGLTATPANYASVVNFTHSNGRHACFERNLNAASENPGIFTSANATSWAASTIAIHPSSAIAVDLSGTIIGDNELDIRNGGSTIILDAQNDTWVAAGATFNAQRQGIIDGLVSAGSETDGWDNVVLAALDVADVVRTSSTRVTITLPTGGIPGYNITANETIEATIPAAALVLAADPAIATPTFAITFLTETATISGSVFGNDEADIRAGTPTIVLTLANVQWEADVGDDNSQTQDLIDGLNSDLAEADGWDAVVRAGLTFANVVRNSNTVVTITLPAFPTYDISANETITVTIPASALDFPDAFVLSPTLLITVFALFPPIVAATAISIDTNTPHTVDLPSGIVAGNLLVILFATREGNDDPALTGWSRIAQATIISDPNGRITFAIFTRTADGTEGASVDVTTVFSQDSAHVAWRITDHDPAQGPEFSLGSFVVTNTPNPAAVTPTGGPKEFLLITMVATSKSHSSSPSDYGNFLSANAAGINLHTVRRNRHIVTEDPGTPAPPLVNIFTLTDPGDPDITLAPTLVIHPLAPVASEITYTVDGLLGVAADFADGAATLQRRQFGLKEVRLRPMQLRDLIGPE